MQDTNSDLKTNPYGQCEELLKIGNLLLDEGKKILGDDFRVRQIFLTLILLERAVDRLRVTLPAGTSQNFPQEKQAAEKDLDLFRKEIWQYAQDFDQKILGEATEELGKSLFNRFVKTKVPPIPTPPTS